MYQAFTGGLGGIALAKHGKSRAINAENPHGEKAEAVWLQVIWDRPEKEARVSGILSRELW